MVPAILIAAGILLVSLVACHHIENSAPVVDGEDGGCGGALHVDAGESDGGADVD